MKWVVEMNDRVDEQWWKESVDSRVNYADRLSRNSNIPADLKKSLSNNEPFDKSNVSWRLDWPKANDGPVEWGKWDPNVVRDVHRWASESDSASDILSGKHEFFKEWQEKIKWDITTQLWKLWVQFDWNKITIPSVNWQQWREIHLDDVFSLNLENRSDRWIAETKITVVWKDGQTNVISFAQDSFSDRFTLSIDWQERGKYTISQSNNQLNDTTVPRFDVNFNREIWQSAQVQELSDMYLTGRLTPQDINKFASAINWVLDRTNTNDLFKWWDWKFFNMLQWFYNDLPVDAKAAFDRKIVDYTKDNLKNISNLDPKISQEVDKWNFSISSGLNSKWLPTMFLTLNDKSLNWGQWVRFTIRNSKADEMPRVK